MKTLLLVFLFLASFGVRAEVVAPAVTVLAEGESLTLKDGRTFKLWKIKRQTAAAVFVMSPAAGVVKIDKQLLPEPLATQFPIDPAAIAAEQTALDKADAAFAARAAANAEAKAKQQARLVAQAKAQERINEKYMKASEERNAKIIKGTEDRAKAEEARRVRNAADLARSFDGLLVENVSRTGNALIVTLRNAAEAPRILHQSDLVVLNSKGETIEAGNCRSMDKNPSLLIDGRAVRVFSFNFLGSGDWQKLAWKGRADLEQIEITTSIARR